MDLQDHCEEFGFEVDKDQSNYDAGIAQVKPNTPATVEEEGSTPFKKPITRSQLQRMKKCDLLTLLQPISSSASIISKTKLKKIIKATPGLVNLKATKTKQERNKISNASNNTTNNPIRNPINNPKRDHKKIYVRKKVATESKAQSKESLCQSANDTIFSAMDPVDPKILLEAVQHPNLAFGLWLNMAGTGHTALSDEMLADQLEAVIHIQTDKDLDACLKKYNNALNASGPLMSCAACSFTDIEIHADKIVTSPQADMTKSTPCVNSFIVVELTEYLLKLHEFSKDRYELFKKTPVEYQAGFTFYKECNQEEEEEKLYNLHAHCIQQDTNVNKVYTRFCTSCHEAHCKGRTYKYAVANGYDFGNLPALLQSAGIDSISLIEQLLCQNVILFYRIIKLTPSGLTSSVQRLSGHVIATRIDSKNVKLTDACLDLDLSKRVMISFEGKIQQWALCKTLLKEKKYLHLQADVSKLRILLKIKSHFDPAFDGKFLDKANNTTQEELDNAVQHVINSAMISEESAAITAAIDAHAADLNDSTEEQLSSDEDGATLTSALVSNLNDAIPANMQDVLGAMFKHAPIEDSNEGKGEWLDSSDEEEDEVLKPAEKTNQEDMILQMTSIPTSAAKTPLSSGKLPQVQISTGNSLMNEFEDMHSILYGLMPFKFLFAQGVELTASGTATCLKKPNIIVCQRNFKQQIQDAIDYPTTPESKALEDRISQVVLHQFLPQAELNIDIPSLEARRKIVADHPGTAAKVCTKMLDAISEQLLGIQWSYVERKTGVATTTRAAIAVHESRGNNEHIHLLYWGSLSPSILSRARTSKKIEAAIGKILDSIIITTLPEDVHAMLHDETLRLTLMPIPSSLDTYATYTHVPEINELLPAYSPQLARLGKQECTNVEWECLRESSLDEEAPSQIELQSQNPFNPFEQPVDDYWVIEQQKPLKDSTVVPCNIGLTLATATNGNHQHAQNAESAIYQQHYTANYSAKDGGQLQKILPLLLTSIEHTEKYPSKAEDAGTVSRQSLYELQQLINNVSQSEELTMISASRCSSGYIGKFFTHLPLYVDVHAWTKYLDRCQRNKESEDDDNMVDEDDDQEDDQEDDQDDAVDSDGMEEDEPDLNVLYENDDVLTTPSDGKKRTHKSFLKGEMHFDDVCKTESAQIFSQGGFFTAIAMYKLYEFRGPELQNFGFCPWQCIIAVVPKKETEQKTKKFAKRCEWAPNCPVQGKYIQEVRTVLKVPQYIGKVPCLPNNFDFSLSHHKPKANRVGKFLLDAFCPTSTVYKRDWHGALDLLHNGSYVNKQLLELIGRATENLSIVQFTGNIGFAMQKNGHLTRNWII
ncbi:hypothetical protein HDU80_008249 [Chytriomyces hyalinus]|nr:hypothetical protein HDU80_008249 [Chytriomyces hyalinus]